MFDGGATHYIHKTDFGALPGTWKRDVPRLRLGDKSFLAVFGSVEKLFAPPHGVSGPPIRRRVLISPGVMCSVWSHPTEVDVHRSTVIDGPDSKHLLLADGRKFPLTVTSGGLRWLGCRVLPSDSSAALLVASGVAPALPSPSALAPCLLPYTARGILPGDEGALCFSAGVGKPPVELTALESMHLWHFRLGHPTLRTLLLAIRLLKLPMPTLTASHLRAFKLSPCDWCNAFKQRRRAVNAMPRRPRSPDILASLKPSPTRALKPLRRVILDVFGPVRVLSFRSNYRFVLGFYDEATGFRWIFGVKDHSAATVEHVCQTLRASLRIAIGEIEIIRSDNAREFAASQRWAEYLADCGIFPEFSVPYSPHQVGGVERGWGVMAPNAALLVAQLGAGLTHWWPACRHAIFLSTSLPSDVVTIDMVRQTSTAHYRLYGVEIIASKLRVYGASVRFVLDEAQRDSKFEEHARAGKYVGISPSNASAMWVYDGSNYITVGGQSVVDETPYLNASPAPADRFPSWPELDLEPTVSTSPAPPPTAPAPPAPAPPPVVRYVLPAGDMPAVDERIEVLWRDHKGDGFRFHRATVTSVAPQPDGRTLHTVEYDGWDGPDRVVVHDLALDRRTGEHIWRPARASPPAAATAPVAPKLKPPTAPRRATRSQAAATVDMASDLDPPDTARRSTRSRGLLTFACLEALLAAAAATPDAPAPVAKRSNAIPSLLAFDAADCDAVSPCRYDPPDIEFSTHDASGPLDSDAAADLAAACSHGARSWAALDSDAILELQACDGCFAVVLDELSNCPTLAKAKATRQVIASRKTVVYRTPDGVLKAIEPKSFGEALKSLQRDQWINAIHVELENLRSHGAFHLVPESEPLRTGKKILRTTYVFKIKVHESLDLDKFKARLCVVGSSMVQGSDYWESYASTARTTSVKLVVITTVAAGWIDFHFDLHGAFLTADIDTDVYVYQPQGPDEERGPNGERMVWKLDKAIYGTVQAARLFTLKLRNALLAMGFETSMDDENVYRLDHELGRIILSTHIDDGIGGASSQAVLDWFYARLQREGFTFSAPPGPWSTVLGFGVHRDLTARTVRFTGAKQINALVHEHLASEAQSARPPMPDTEEFMTLQPPPPETPEQSLAFDKAFRSKARSLKGALIYLVQIHPAIAHAVSRVCSLMAKPTERSYACAKRILAWLQHHQDLGVVFGGPHIRCLEDLAPRGAAPCEPMSPRRDYSLACCVDSDLSRKNLPVSSGDARLAALAPDGAASRSQLGYEISLAGGCFDACSKRQHSVAVDTAAAELFAASAAAAHLINITGVLFFISFSVLGHHPVPLWCDNEACVLVTQDASSTKRLAYVARRVRLLQQLQFRGLIDIRKVDGTANPADPLTKSLKQKRAFRDYMARLYNVGAHRFA